MKTIWERFDSALGEIASQTVFYNTRGRQYTVVSDGRSYAVEARQVYHDMLRLTLSLNTNGHTCIDMLKANGRSPFWKFTLPDTNAVLQAEVFADEFEHAREIICDISSAQDFLNGKTDRAPVASDSKQIGDDLRMKRMRFALEAGALKSVRSNDGSYVMELRHAGANSNYQIRCRTIATQQIMEMKGLISLRIVETDAARHFLLRRCVDLSGCRATLDADGLSYVVAFIPFSTIENGNVARRYELLLEGLFQLRHVESLNDRKVSHIYQQLNMKGNSYGNHASGNQSPVL